MTAPRQAVEIKVPIRCLVIQLARLGDTLQSLMALRAAKQLYPHLEIYFLARDKFASAAQRISWIKEVITFPTETILGPIFTGEKSETEALGDLAQWIAPLVKDPWDMIVNWSFSDASSYLTGLLPSKVKLGYTRRRDTSFAGADGWSHYVQAIVQGKVNQNIHLTDILTTQLLTALQIHAGDPLPEGNASVTSKGFFSLLLKDGREGNERIIDGLPRDKSKKWISLQVGAGQKYKTWEPTKWATLIKLLIQKYPEYGIFLLGGPEDIDRAKTIMDEISPLIQDSHSFFSLVGETNFDRWASVISRSQWLLAGDTAAIHLASVLGTRVLNISIGPVRYAETGPYGNGHYVISSSQTCSACNSTETSSNPEDHTCSNDVTAEAVFATWSYASNEWAHHRQISLENHFNYLTWNSHLNRVKILRSRIRNTQDGGGVLYESVIKRPITIEDWTAMVNGQIARSWYCGWTPPIGQELSRETISPLLVKFLQELKSSTEVLAKICDQASHTALLLTKKSSALKSARIMSLGDKEELTHLGKALSELDILIERLAKTHPPLSTFSQMSKVLMHHLKGDHLADLGRETAECYKQLREGVSIFRDWIKFTLELIRPRTIKSASVTSLGGHHRPPEASR